MLYEDNECVAPNSDVSCLNCKFCILEPEGFRCRLGNTPGEGVEIIKEHCWDYQISYSIIIMYYIVLYLPIALGILLLILLLWWFL